MFIMDSYGYSFHIKLSSFLYDILKGNPWTIATASMQSIHPVVHRHLRCIAKNGPRKAFLFLKGVLWQNRHKWSFFRLSLRILINTHSTTKRCQMTLDKNGRVSLFLELKMVFKKDYKPEYWVIKWKCFGFFWLILFILPTIQSLLVFF